MSDYPAITGLAALFGWMFWFFGFSMLGERLNPNKDNHSWPSIFTSTVLGGLSFYPLLHFQIENDRILEGADIVWSVAFYFAFAVGGFFSGFGWLRFWTRLRLGKLALAKEDAKDSKRRYLSDLDYVEREIAKQLGSQDQELRKQRVKDPSHQLEVDASKSET